MRKVTAALAGPAVIATLVWLLACLALWTMQESLIFHPQSLSAHNRQSLLEHALSFEAGDGTTLAGWAIPLDGARGAVYFSGGNSQEISGALADLPGHLQLAAAGHNYRGFGDSGGKASAAKLRSDALAGFDAAVERLGVPAERWIVLGRSLGGHMAAHIAANRPVGGVVLATPFDSVTELAARRYPIFPVRMMLRHPFDSVAETGSIAAPTLIVKAARDRVVPTASTDRLIAGWKGSGEVAVATVAGTTHGDIENRDEYWDLLRGFVDKALGSAAPGS